MKMSDVLRDLADLLDQKSAEVAAPVDQPIVTVQDAGVSTDDKESEVGTFVPPLQQKLELLKKATGVENSFDDNQSVANADELDRIKKLGGIAPAAIVHIAGDDLEIE